MDKFFKVYTKMNTRIVDFLTKRFKGVCQGLLMISACIEKKEAVK